MQQDIFVAFSSFASESRLEVIICLLILRTKIAFIKIIFCMLNQVNIKTFTFWKISKNLKNEKSGRGLTLRLTANRDIAVAIAVAVAVAVAVVNLDRNPGFEKTE